MSTEVWYPALCVCVCACAHIADDGHSAVLFHTCDREASLPQAPQRCDSDFGVYQGCLRDSWSSLETLAAQGVSVVVPK